MGAELNLVEEPKLELTPKFGRGSSIEREFAQSKKKNLIQKRKVKSKLAVFKSNGAANRRIQHV